MTLVSQTPVLLACAGQATQLTVLVHWVHDPVDACILHGQIKSCYIVTHCILLVMTTAPAFHVHSIESLSPGRPTFQQCNTE